MKLVKLVKIILVSCEPRNWNIFESQKHENKKPERNINTIDANTTRQKTESLRRKIIIKRGENVSLPDMFPNFFAFDWFIKTIVIIY